MPLDSVGWVLCVAATYHTRMTREQLQNPFETLGLPISYRVDRDRVERAYRARLALAHPDAGGDDGGIDPATLNDARKVLLNDEQRAVRVLDLMGGPSASKCKDLPDGFLMDMMMQRQEIEAAIESGGEQEREEWEQWGIEQRAQFRDRIAEMFDSLDNDADVGTLRAIRIELNAWRYIERLIEQLDPEYDPSHADFS